jgi:DNA-binding transcriptional LysR family regulator
MSYQLEFRHLKYFLALAEELHYGKAAQRLFISQPGLSRQIKQMEDLLGYPLFIRNNKKVALSTAGHYLAKEIPSLIENMQRILKQGSAIDQGMDGEIKIGFVGSAMQNIIPNLLVKSKEKFPGIKFNLEEISNYDQIDQLLHGKLDLGFVRLNRVDPSIQIRPIFEDSFSLVVPENFPFKSISKKAITYLNQQKFILFDKSYSPDYYNTIMQILDDLNIEASTTHNSVHANTIFRLIENNMGVSIVPTALTKGFNLKIRFIELKIKHKAVLSVVWNKGNGNPVLGKLLGLIAGG